MVERKINEEFTEFSGKVVKVEVEDTKFNDGTQQYHIYIQPLDIEIKGKSGYMHEWIRIPESATENTVPEGCVLDRFISELELLDSSVKKIPFHVDVFTYMNGKSFVWIKKKLGKSFDGKAAKEYWTPYKIIQG
jgi:hypothetical protein